MLGAGALVGEGDEVGGLHRLAGPAEQGQGGSVCVPPAAGPRAPERRGRSGRTHRHLGQGLVLEQPTGVLAVVPGPAHDLVGVALHAVLGVAAGPVHGRQGGLEHAVLVGVVGLGGGSADEQPGIAGGRRTGRHRLAPEHRTPDLADAPLGLVGGGDRPSSARWWAWPRAAPPPRRSWRARRPRSARATASGARGGADGDPLRVVRAAPASRAARRAPCPARRRTPRAPTPGARCRGPRRWCAEPRRARTRRAARATEWYSATACSSSMPSNCGRK